MAEIQEKVAALRRHAEAMPDGTTKHIALSLVADMEFTLGHEWGEGLPTAESIVTQRCSHNFSSAMAVVSALAGVSEEGRIEWTEIEFRGTINGDDKKVV